MKEISYGCDGDFTWERYEERYNVDLANNLGNLVSRLSAMAERYRGRASSPVRPSGRLPGVVDEAVRTYRGIDGTPGAARSRRGGVSDHRCRQRVHRRDRRRGRWPRTPQHTDRLTGVLFDVAEAVRVAAVLLLPIMPASAAEILRRVGDRTPVASLRLDRDTRWRGEGERQIIKGPALWPRYEDTASAGVVTAGAAVHPTSAPAAKETSVTDTPAPSPATVPEDGRLGIDEFMKVELRTAKVLDAEAVPKSKKLIKLRVDAGAEERTIVAGIAEAYTPEQLIGRTIVIVANLKPAKLMGVESNGMVLAASVEGGAPSLLSVEGGIPPGTRVR